jgi:hypothetical protein
MSAVRGLLRDLIERKLWPVAVLLLLAAIAVPVYLGRSSSDETTPQPPIGQQAAVGKSSKAAVTIEDPTTQDRGSVRNPFRQQHAPKATPTTTGTTTTSGSTPAAGDGSPTGGAGSGSGGSGTSQPVQTPSGSGTKPKSTDADKLDVFHLTVRVGRADGKLRTLKDVARLSPLPSVDDPFLVYTGVLKDGKTAVFLLSSDAHATGDGTCKPKATDCESVELKKDQTEFFDILVDGQPVQYELDLVDITPAGSDSSSSSDSTGTSTSTGHAAVAAATRHSKAGAELLRKAHVNGSKAYGYADAYRWLPDRGVLVRTPKHGGAQASVTGAVAASAADLAATLPGQPVWHWQLGG